MNTLFRSAHLTQFCDLRKSLATSAVPKYVTSASALALRYGDPALANAASISVLSVSTAAAAMTA